MRSFIGKLRQSLRNGRALGDSRWFIVRQALGGHFLTDEKFVRFVEWSRKEQS